MTTSRTSIRRGWHPRRHRLSHRLNLPDYKCAVFPKYTHKHGLRWQAHVMRRENRDRLFSRHYETREEAQIVAHGLLVAMRDWYARRRPRP